MNGIPDGFKFEVKEETIIIHNDIEPTNIPGLFVGSGRISGIVNINGEDYDFEDVLEKIYFNKIVKREAGVSTEEEYKSGLD